MPGSIFCGITILRVMKLYLLGLLLIGLPVFVSGSNACLPFGGRQAGMGNAGVSLYDFWAIGHNQAGIAHLENAAAGFYFENRYHTREMAYGAAAFILPTTSGVFGINVSYFGFSLYNESRISLAYARAFGERLSTGLQLNYMHTYIGEGYGSTANATVELGFIYELLPGLNIGAHIFNPTQARIADYADERLPVILRTGLSYSFSENLMVIAETEKDINHKAVFRAGIEYQLTEGVNVRAGLGTFPATNAFGFGLRLGSADIDIASSFHNILGYSHQISILYNFN